MRWYSLDSIVRSLLLKEGKTLHYYIQYLSYATAGLKALHTHTLKNVNTKKLPVNSYKAITLPCDYVDFVGVGMEVGERIRPLVEDPTLNRLNNYDDSNTKVPFTSVLPDGTPYSDPDTASDLIYGDVELNHRVDRQDFRFKVLKERGEIQLSADYPYDYVILEYVTDGLEADNATQVDPLAQAALEKYILWQAEVHKRNNPEGKIMAAEKRYLDEWRLLRAAKNPMTKADYIHAVRSGYSPLVKN